MAALAVSLIIFSTIGFSVLRPWDPESSISLLLADNQWYLLIRVAALLFAVSALSAVIIDGRLPQFGGFAASVGLAYPVIKTGGMDYLMVRMQAGKEFEDPASLWGYLALEMLGWTVVLAVCVAGSALAERWVSNGQGSQDSSETTRAKKDTKSAGQISRGILGTLLTALVATFLVLMLCASRHKGQVIFAVAAAFFLGSLAGDRWAGNRHPLWQVAAVPLVGLFAYLYTWQVDPYRPAGFEAILHVAPNNLASVLPIEYLCAGVAAAIFGTWTAERVRYSKRHG